MIKTGEITKDEHITLIGYSHGGNVSIRAARILNKKFGIKVNLLTVSTPEYHTDWKDAYGGGPDPEDTRFVEGINAHTHIVHEKDTWVTRAAGGNKTFKDKRTNNYVVPNLEIPISDPVKAHTDLPGHDKFDVYLKEVPKMKKAPAPAQLDGKKS
jgi:hypothetical protein